MMIARIRHNAKNISMNSNTIPIAKYSTLKTKLSANTLSNSPII